MFKEGTVFIVGAGASAEVGFPIGAELSEIIARLLQMKVEFGGMSECDWPIWNAWNSKFGSNISELNAHIGAGKQVAAGIFLARSIDNYLYQHDHDARVIFCGKSAIVRAILKAERDSDLFLRFEEQNQPYDVRRVENTWYTEFARILMEGRRKEDLKNLFQGISIICFNYDRSIKQYLAYAISSLYAVPLDRAKEAIDTLRIIHPYGSVGDLKFPRTIGKGIEYGAEVDDTTFLTLCDQIRVRTH